MKISAAVTGRRLRTLCGGEPRKHDLDAAESLLQVGLATQSDERVCEIEQPLSGAEHPGSTPVLEQLVRRLRSVVEQAQPCPDHGECAESGMEHLGILRATSELEGPGGVV